MLFGPNIIPFNIRMQDQQHVFKSEKAKKLLLIKVFFIGATIKVLLTGATIKLLLKGATMTDYRKNGNFWSKLMKMKYL